MSGNKFFLTVTSHLGIDPFDSRGSATTVSVLVCICPGNNFSTKWPLIRHLARSFKRLVQFVRSMSKGQS